jgi:hypothetical protein
MRTCAVTLVGKLILNHFHLADSLYAVQKKRIEQSSAAGIG